MQNFVPAFIAAFLASVLTVVVLEVVRDDGPADPETAGLTPPGASAPATDALIPEGTLALTGGEGSPRLQDLEMRISTLESQLNQLATARQPVLSEEMREQVAKLDDPEAAEFILGVLADKEEADRQARAEERRQRAEERLLNEVNRMADAVGLTGPEKDKVFGIFVEADARRTAMFETMRNGDFGQASREETREMMNQLRDWQSTALVEGLGPDLAAEVETYQSENTRRGGMGGFGGGGRRGGGGRGN